MNYKIFVIGKIQNKCEKQAIAEYAKRLTRYCKIKLVELKNIESLEKKLRDKTYVIRISPSGKNLSSEELADKIENLALTGKSDVSIVYTEEDIKCNEHLALSYMEMGLGMTITVLYEQIYRAYRIINNQAYHK